MIYSMKPLYWGTSILFVFSLLSAFGCASKGVAHVESITAAESAIKQAQDSNATIHAPLELKLAEDKLNAAKAAVEKEEFLKAKRLADEALMDAKLAEEISLSEKEKKLVQEMFDGIETLRREIERAQIQKQ